MAVVTFDRRELKELIGRNVSDKELENRVPMMGCDVENVTDDELEVEIFPNRPDLLSVEGFARSLKQFLGEGEGVVEYGTTEGELEVKVDGSVEDVRPFISAGVVRGVDVDEDILRSLMQAQEKIHTTLGRKRRKVAIGIHDLGGVEGPFTYKAVEPEEIEFTPLGFKDKVNLLQIKEKHPKGEYAKILEGKKRWPVITDSEGMVLSFPPVINGVATEVTEETEDLFIDVTGTDQTAVDQALNLITSLLAERGGTIETVTVDGNVKPEMSPDRIEVDREYINRLLNLDLSDTEVRESLNRMGLDYSEGTAVIPCYRVDVMHPMDVVEDVAIGYGYENFEPKIPDVPGIGSSDEPEEFADRLRDIMMGFGFQEVINTVLTNKERQFTMMEEDEMDVVETENPLSEKHCICRRKLLPGILEVFRQNKHRSYPQRIFEVGDVVITTENGADNAKRMSAAITGRKVNYTDIASILDFLLESLGIDYILKEAEGGRFMDSRGAYVLHGDKEIGSIGEINPEVLENWSLEKPVVSLELDIEKVMESADSSIL